jgi:myo-inositol-1-phosphate synthase
MTNDTSSRSVVTPEGKLGVLLVGLGAVSTTFVAGVEAIRRGRAKPFGSVTQMNTIRLGKRTESRVPLVREFVPLAELDDLVFGAWDPIPDDAYRSAEVCGVLRPEAIGPSEEFLRSIQPMPAVFDKQYVKKLDGPNVKSGRNKRDLAEQLRQDIRDFQSASGCARMRAGHGDRRRGDRALDAVRVSRYSGGCAVRQRRPESHRRRPRPQRAGA